MRIESIHGENFLSYQQLDLEIKTGISSLTGENLDNPGNRSNGAGKTALIDLISWVFFGETTRGISGDDVINLQAEKGTRGEVRLSGGVSVIRHRKYPKLKNSVIIEQDGEKTQFDRMKDAQHQIERLLGVDWLSFRQSALFGQDATRFLGLPDSEKKGVIERILGIEVLDTAAELARKEVRHLREKSEKAERDAELARERERSATNELRVRRDELAEKREHNKKEQAEIAEEIKLQERDLSELQQQVGEFEALGTELDQAHTELDQAVAEVERLESLEGERRGRLETLQDKSGRLEREAREFEQAAELIRADADSRASSIESRTELQRKGIAEVEEAIEAEEDGFEKTLSELRAKKSVALADAKKYRAQEKGFATALEKETKRSAELEHDDAELLATLRGVEGEQARFEVGKAALIERIDKMQHASGACCPTCEQSVPAKHVDSIVKGLREMQAENEKALKRLDEQIDEIADAGIKLGKELDAVRDAANRSDRGRREAKLRASQSDESAKEIDKRIAKATEESELRTSHLVKRADALEEFDPAAEVKAVEVLRARIEQQASLAAGARRELAGLMTPLRVASEELGKTGDELKSARKRHSEHTEALSELQRKRDVMSERKSLTDSKIKEALDGLHKRLQTLSDQRFDSEAAEIDKVAQRAHSCREEADQKAAEVAGARNSIEAHEFWAEGFGLRGLRSMMLDGVLPFLEDRANGYLEDLTGGTFKIGLSPISETKGGKLKDSLAVALSSSSGGNQYKALSGGERQRVDISFAMALFDLARSRAGVDLGIAIFDEVFERLDDAGCEAVAGLLRRNASRWGTVLVVTHLDSLLSSLPSKHRIVKENGQSRIEVR